MKTLEIFSGTGSFSKMAKKRGHDTFTVDIDKSFCPDLCIDVIKDKDDETLNDMVMKADIIWMSPPCDTFSMAAGNTHWTKDRKPKTKKAEKALDMIKFCIYIAEYCEKTGKLFFIENPVARARWFIPKSWRKTVWYCQYGDKRAKPTDIWTNLKGWQPKTCSNDALCHHEKAPRGSKTGTQGLKGKKVRGEIPPGLFEELFDVIEGKVWRW